MSKYGTGRSSIENRVSRNAIWLGMTGHLTTYKETPNDEKTDIDDFVNLSCVCAGFAQTTEFNYQGSLRDGAAPANANYDFERRHDQGH